MSGRPSRPGLSEPAQDPQAPVGAEHVRLRRVGQGDRAPHPHEVRDPVPVGRQFQVGEHQHPAQAVPDPVDPVVPGLAP